MPLDTSDLPVRQLGNYELLAKVAEGGMGAVYRGRNTATGDIVAVIGNCPELGEWDVDRCFRLEYLNPGTWQGGIAFEATAGKQVTYKYMIIREDAGLDPPRRENRTTRRRVIPETGTAKWRDIWEE